MNIDKNQKIALVTGANRGIGLEVCKQLGKIGFGLILAVRNLQHGANALNKLKEEKIEAECFELDLGNERSTGAFAEKIRDKFDRIDVLVNNADVYISGTPSKVSNYALETSLQVNLVGPWILTRELLPLIKKSPSGRIINVSSGAGQLDRLNASYSAYRVSKLGLNGFTQMLDDEVSGGNMSVNAVGPGWVRTRMGGSGASISVEQGADSIVWLATTENPPTGKFIRERKIDPW